MKWQIRVKGRQFATNLDGTGVFELVGGAYRQHRGNGSAGPFWDQAAFRRYVQRMLRGEI